MAAGKRGIKVFKIKNRSGYAATCADHLNEGNTPKTACDRMEKALKRREKRE